MITDSNLRLTFFSKGGHGEEQSKKKYLIFVNPKGGKGFAQKIWLSSGMRMIRSLSEIGLGLKEPQ